FAALMSLSKAPEDTTLAAAAESRRKRLLPGLLSMANSAGVGRSMDDLQLACAYLDDQAGVSEAYDLWRGDTAGGKDGTALASYIRHMVRVASNELADGCGTRVLAVHDQASILSSTGLRGQLRASVLVTD